MTYEKFVSEASEVFLQSFEATNCLVRASQLTAAFCSLNGESKEFAAKLCSQFRKAAEKNFKRF